jgi:hypothetical protein
VGCSGPAAALDLQERPPTGAGSSSDRDPSMIEPRSVYA